MKKHILIALLLLYIGMLFSLNIPAQIYISAPSNLRYEIRDGFPFLSWDAPDGMERDNSSNYGIYRNGIFIATVRQRGFLDRTAIPEQNNTYSVVRLMRGVRVNRWHESAHSNTINITVQRTQSNARNARLSSHPYRGGTRLYFESSGGLNLINHRDNSGFGGGFGTIKFGHGRPGGMFAKLEAGVVDDGEYGGFYLGFPFVSYIRPWLQSSLSLGVGLDGSTRGDEEDAPPGVGFACNYSLGVDLGKSEGVILGLRAWFFHGGDDATFVFGPFISYRFRSGIN
jgi:hypothetical protein